MADSLQFSPSETLCLSIGLATPAQTALRITNPSTRNCAFKVKTTTPERYLVKPNHGIIRVGGTAEITIVIVQAKKKDLLAKARLSGPVKCGDKFLVQNVGIDQTTTENLETITSHELADAIARLFNDKAKNELGSKKLLVDLDFPDYKQPAEYLPSKDVATEQVHLPSLHTETPPSLPSTPEAMFAEIVNLRKKYDDLVAFTVNVTTERDSLLSDLDSARKGSTLPGNSGPREVSHGSGGSTSAKGAGSMMYTILIALVAFLLGRFVAGGLY